MLVGGSAVLALFYLLLAALFAFAPAGLARIGGQDTTAHASLSQAVGVDLNKHKRPRCGGPEDEHNKKDNEHRGKRDIEHEPKNDHDPKQCPISNQ